MCSSLLFIHCASAALQYAPLTFNVCTNPLMLSSELIASRLVSKSNRQDGNISMTHPLICHTHTLHVQNSSDYLPSYLPTNIIAQMLSIIRGIIYFD